MDHPRAIRWSLAAALFVEFVGLIYDTFWHDLHLSEVAIPPSRLLTVHSGIYVGELIVIAIAAVGLRSGRGGPVARGVLWGIIAAGVLQLVGSGFDMWSHAHAYEKTLYHATIYTGAGLTAAGYLLLEALAFQHSRQELALEEAGEAAEANGASGTAETAAADEAEKVEAGVPAEAGAGGSKSQAEHAEK